MKVSQLYTYPIKSLRGVPLTSTEVTKYGFPYDRRFMLLKVNRDDQSTGAGGSLQNMTITHFPAMALFQQELHCPDKGEASRGSIRVIYQPADGGEKGSLDIPLLPNTNGLDVMDIVLHRSPTKAYNMGSPFNGWFSRCFGYDTVLVYIGPHTRPILGNLSPNASVKGESQVNSWLSSIANYLPTVRTSQQEAMDGIKFTDVAAYLVVTEESLNNVSSRLLGGEEMDITKFRPNIVLSGSPAAYDEDFWADLVWKHQDDEGEKEPAKEAKFILTQNCARCVSINIDYATGKQAQGQLGAVFKKLMKDRRVDKGTKYSPIFGRYGFLKAGTTTASVIAVGDEVQVTKRNSERTTFGKYQLSTIHANALTTLEDWPGLNN
ncbi:MAG: hypothetical protein Q9187_005094 [Circinaria calcarea]